MLGFLVFCILLFVAYWLIKRFRQQLWTALIVSLTYAVILSLSIGAIHVTGNFLVGVATALACIVALCKLEETHR